MKKTTKIGNKRVKTTKRLKSAKPAKKRILSRYPKKPQAFHYTHSGLYTYDAPDWSQKLKQINTYFSQLPDRKPCDKCNGTMIKQYEVVEDEIPFNIDDSELAHTLSMYYECRDCGRIIDIGSYTTGSGILR